MDGNRSALELWDGPTYQDILDQDEQNIPEIIREHVVRDLGSEPISARRYTDAGFFMKEVEHVFLKTWQYACRTEEIPEVGDSYIFDLVGRSLVVVRQRDGSIKALENVCGHRGRKIATQGGCKAALRCPYHGFTWEIDGSFRKSPVAWDFPEIDPANFPLFEARVAVWAGFVFVNFDRDAVPLEEVLGPLPRHFVQWRMDECYKSAHVGKIMPANWKAVAEAFIENHHVSATHPQIAAYIGDANSQYDTLSDHVTRAIGGLGMPGLVYEGGKMTPHQMLRGLGQVGRRMGTPPEVAPDSNVSVRRVMGDLYRQVLSEATGRDLSDVTDAEVVDSFSYDLVPNFHIWGGLGTKISYRFRPVGLDHESTFMEVMLYKLAPIDRPVPPPAQLRMLSDEDAWAGAHELEFLAGVFDQDEANMAPTQEGLKALGDRKIHFGRYSEIRCRNLHRMVDVYIAKGEARAAKVQSGATDAP